MLDVAEQDGETRLFVASSVLDADVIADLGEAHGFDAAAEAIAHPLGRLEVEIRAGDTLRSFSVFLSRWAVVFAVPADGERYELVTRPVTLAPLVLAEALRIGPLPVRPFADLVVVARAPLEARLATGEAWDESEIRDALGLDAAVPDELASALAALPSLYRTHVISTLRDDRGSELWRLEFIDGGKAGYWECMPLAYLAAGEVALISSRGTLIWSAISSILGALGDRDTVVQRAT